MNKELERRLLKEQRTKEITQVVQGILVLAFIGLIVWIAIG